MSLTFEWDPEKAAANVEKHGVSFEEATTVFADKLSLTIEDPLHSAGEPRFVSIGESSEHDILVVVYLQRATRIRVITCARSDPQGA